VRDKRRHGEADTCQKPHPEKFAMGKFFRAFRDAERLTEPDTDQNADGFAYHQTGHDAECHRIQQQAFQRRTIDHNAGIQKGEQWQNDQHNRKLQAVFPTPQRRGGYLCKIFDIGYFLVDFRFAKHVYVISAGVDVGESGPDFLLEFARSMLNRAGTVAATITPAMLACIPDCTIAPHNPMPTSA
jgi:hypothetical protein